MKILYFTFSTLVFLSSSGCGVKGDPLPPQTPAEIGRGQPTYRRATEEFAEPELPPAAPNDDDSQKKYPDDED